MRRAVLVEERPRRIGGRMAAPDQDLGGRPPDAQLVREPVSILRRARVDQPGGRGLGHPAMLGRSSDVAYPGAIGAKANLHVTTWGQGTRALLVHGSMSFGELAFSEQRPLAERRRLDARRPARVRTKPRPAPAGGLRRGCPRLGGASRRARRTSSATPTAASCACWRQRSGPRRCARSTVIEPPAFALARGSRRSRRSSPDRPPLRRGPGAHRGGVPRRLLARMGLRSSWPPWTLSPRARRGVRSSMTERMPWEADDPARPARGGRPPGAGRPRRLGRGRAVRARARRRGVRGGLRGARRELGARGGGLPGRGPPAAAPRRTVQRPPGGVLASASEPA